MRNPESSSLPGSPSPSGDGCITYHTATAREQDATREEIAEALGVTISINASAALVSHEAQFHALAQYESGKSYR
jgi:alkylhydroperoxidase/carboxymuconolactone decarboxylase family protein YurZ